jgi:hypothetical protein
MSNMQLYSHDVRADHVYISNSAQYSHGRSDQLFVGSNFPQNSRERVDRFAVGPINPQEKANKPGQQTQHSITSIPPTDIKTGTYGSDEVKKKTSCFVWTPKWQVQAWKKHWTAIHLEQGEKAFKETFAMDRTALCVAGALLMTVDFAALMLSRQNFNELNTENEKVIYVYLVAFGVACAASLSLIITGTFQYLIIHKFGAREPLDMALFLEDITPVWFTPITLMMTSCYATVIGAGSGVYLLHGWEGCIAFGAPGAVLFTTTFYFGMRGAILAEHRFFRKMGMGHDNPQKYPASAC